VLVPVTHQHPNVDWGQEKLRYRSLVLRQLGKLGLADLERRIRFERTERVNRFETAAIRN
ncbi:MAG: hypothetical protein ACUVQK_16010, partial [Thermogutta sp.]